MRSKFSRHYLPWEPWDRRPDHFYWIRPSGSFDLAQGRLVWEGQRDPVMYAVDPYSMDGLFYTFAKLDFHPESIRDFAGRYGPLALDRSEYKTHPLTVRRLDGGSLEDWIYHIGEMRTWVEIWEHADVESAHLLPFEFDGDQITGTFRYDFRAQPSISAAELAEEDSFLWGDLQNDGHSWVLASYAESLLNIALGDKLEKLTSPGHVGVMEGSSLYPSNLLGAMWLQFSLAQREGAEFRECGYSQCSKWFKVMGKSRKYCSKTCSAYASRERMSKKVAKK